ncbi:MAG: TlpA family protein disulfide reductase [Parabacteroides sp.]|nr:TlpA family protein disulfide reductase [Parabacteroides sp.]
MKTTCPGWAFLVFLLACAGCRESQEAYLKTVLNNLQQIEAASYNEFTEGWEPGDTAAVRSNRLVKEYRHPADTTIGAAYASFDARDTARLCFAYDGSIRAFVYPDDTVIFIDDFSSRRFPFRPVNPPFFNYAESILRYALETTDSITTEWQDAGPDYRFRLVIHEPEQVEFFGKAIRMPANPYVDDPASAYELWIRKADRLPYKIRREMSHGSNNRTCTGLVFYPLPGKGLDIDAYFPDGYEIRKYGEQKTDAPGSGLLGKPAPGWELAHWNGRPVTLSGLKEKVVVMNFTGIGCGPCKAAIPFLNGLQSRFAPGEVGLVAIESWGKQPASLKIYAGKYAIGYPFVCGTDEVLTHYLGSSRGVPVFFILDEKRTVRQIIRGYRPETTGNELTNAISGLL